MDDIDDLTAVDPLQVDGGDPKVGVTELERAHREESALLGRHAPALLRHLEPALHRLGALQQRLHLVEPWRTSIAPRPGSRSPSDSAKASLIRRSARQSTTASPRKRRPTGLSPA